MSSQTSAKTGVAPWYNTQLAVAQNVSRSRDCLVARPKSGGKSSAVQRSRTGTEADGIPGADPIRKRLFKLANLRPGRQPVRPKNVHHRLDVVVIQALPSVRQQFLTHRSSAMDCEASPGLAARKACYGRGRERLERHWLPARPTPPVHAASATVVGVARIAESFRQRLARSTQFSDFHQGCDG